MKITKTRLKKIIQEEISKILCEEAYVGGGPFKGGKVEIIPLTRDEVQKASKRWYKLRELMLQTRIDPQGKTPSDHIIYALRWVAANNQGSADLQENNARFQGGTIEIVPLSREEMENASGAGRQLQDVIGKSVVMDPHLGSFSDHLFYGLRWVAGFEREETPEARKPFEKFS